VDWENLPSSLQQDISNSQLPNEFHGHFDTCLEYVISVISWVHKFIKQLKQLAHSNDNWKHFC